MDLLPASAPDDVVDHVRELQVSVLDDEAETLDDMGLADADEAKTVLRRIFERLQTLRRKNQDLQRAQEAMGVDASRDLVDEIESLQERVRAFEDQKDALDDAGFEQPIHALEALHSMEEQLRELYEEKQATEQTDVDTQLRMEGDTFDQLQALLAREEKLQRELGVSNPDAVVEMVEGLSDQLDELYQDRDSESATDSIFSPSEASVMSAERMLEEEFGVSDPETLTTMVNDLTEQLDELYSERERLAELGLQGTDDAVEMLENMQRQLETLYERRQELAEREVGDFDHALSLIDSMEDQLNAIYDERHELASQQDLESPDEVAARLEELEAELQTLVEEKEALRKKRDDLQAQLDELRDELGLDDPNAISDLIHSLEDQLQEVYAEREEMTSASLNRSLDEGDLLNADTLARLDEMDKGALDALTVGLFKLDDEGIVRDANQQALQWPDVLAESLKGIVGKNFFSDVAPGTDNTLFRGRFEEGVASGSMDEPFTYTYVSEAVSPTNLAVHLYSSSHHSSYWIVFAVLEQY